MSIRVLQLILIISVAAIPAVPAEDWPQWRGPRSDGTLRGPALKASLPDGQLPWLWQASIGPGYSGPTVADGRVLVTDRQASDTAEQERVLCFSAADGALQWQHVYDAPYTVGYRAGPRASVTIHDGKAFAVGAMGHFHCLDLATGTVLWKRDLNTELQIQMPIWGIAGSPLIYRNLVIQIAGGQGPQCVLAMDQATGKTVWAALDEPAGYSAPILIRQGGEDVLVCWTGAAVSGLAPLSGQVLWSLPLEPRNMPINVATPVTDGRHLFVSSFYDGSMLIRLDPQRPAASLLWRRIGRDEKNTDALHCMISTPLLKGQHIYGVDSYGELRCLDLTNGDRLWESDQAVPGARWATVHTFQDGDREIMFNDQGELIFGKLTPSGFEIDSRAQLIPPTRIQLNRRNGVTWAHPAIAAGVIYARNDESLVAASLAQ